MPRRYNAKDHPRALDHARHGYLTKRVEIRIVVPGARDIRHVCKARPGEYINEAGVASILEQEASRLEQQLPQHDFRLVELAPNRFNLIGQVKAQDPIEFVSPGVTHEWLEANR